MRWILAGVIAAILLLGVGGVAFAHFHAAGVPVASVQRATKCSDAYRLLAMHPSQVTTANSVCLVQSLKFSGELSGSVAEAYTVTADGVAPTAMCAEPKRWDGYPPALLAMVIGSKAYRLRIAVPGVSEHQALTLNSLASVVELAAINDPSSDWSQASGTLTLNPDGTTGSIDASLLRDVAGAQPVHLSGEWACGAPLPLPTYDATAPCSSFYAVNKLPDADVARMKASACITQDLTFSGDLASHLDHAVTDRAIDAGPGGLEADNSCSGINEDYVATLKFTIGDETFLLHLGAHNYPSVGPGQYPAASAGLGGMFLFTGYADPTNHGVFVQDPNVLWIGASGAFTIAQDMKSGTIEAELSALKPSVNSTVHIKGSWRCAA